MAALVKDVPTGNSSVHFGVAPHSVRAVPLHELHEIAGWARANALPVHMHVAEQVAENAACVREYGSTPVDLLAGERILGPDFTAVHGVHVTAEEIAMLASAETTICSCPTTERNLGDGFVRADEMLAAGIHFALGRTARRRSTRSKMRGSWSITCGCYSRSERSWTRWEGRRWRSLCSMLLRRMEREHWPCLRGRLSRGGLLISSRSILRIVRLQETLPTTSCRRWCFR
jgi:hypothetical protein